MKDKSIFDKITDFTNKFAEPMYKLTLVPWISAIQEGLVAIMPIIIVGSLFLVLSSLGLPWIGSSGEPLVPFLTPYTDKLLVIFNLTMGFLALYAAVAIGMAYGRKNKIDELTSGLLALISFILMTVNTTTLTGVVTENGADIAFSIGGINVDAFGAAGLFTAMLVGIFSIKLYKLFVDSNIVIKLPDSVPPNIANAFSALIPYTAVFLVAWFIRTGLNFNLATWVTTLLLPVFKMADSMLVFTLRMTVGNLLWFAGLHGDNMLGAIKTPLLTTYIADNGAAMAAGQPLPYVWTEQLERMVGWTATVWPLLILLFRSKVKHHRTFALAALPAAIFTIIEPVMFGLPLVLNPILFIPYMTITVVTSIFTYGVAQFNLVGRFYAALPWATPPFILGPASSGDWKWIIVIAINVLIGFLIYLPFFKMLEKQELKTEMESTE